MKIKEQFKITDNVRIKVYEGAIKPENLVKEITLRNTMTTAGLKLIMDKLAEDVSGSTKEGPQHVWIGDGSTVASATDTDLDSYQSEKALTNYVRAGDGLIGTWDVTFGTGDSNHEWEEIGLASDAHGTGTLMARQIFTSQLFTKLNTQQVVVEYELTIV